MNDEMPKAFVGADGNPRHRAAFHRTDGRILQYSIEAG
jgi:hypothetical protein